MAKKVRKKRTKDLPLHERDPKNPNWTRGGKWLGPEKK